MTLLKQYEVAVGQKFEEIMNDFETNKVLHFASVKIDNGEYDFLLLDKDLFGTVTNGYFFVNKNDPTVYSNLNDSQIGRAYMYTLMLKDDDALNDPEAFFQEPETIKKVKMFQRTKRVSAVPNNQPIVYNSDYDVIVRFVTRKFNKYIADCAKLQAIFTFVFEQKHHQYFDRLKGLKDNFGAFKTDMKTVDSLKQDGIYLEPMLYEAIKDGLESKDNILMTGPTGSGKSKVTFYLLRSLNIPYMTIECNDSLRYDEIFASATLDENKNIVPVFGKAVIAYRDGHTLILEEMTALSDRLFKSFLTYMVHDELSLQVDVKTDEGEFIKHLVIPRHPNFRVIATANEEKRYNVNALTPQVKRRFETIIPMNYLPEKEEIELITQRLQHKELNFNEEDVSKIVKIGNHLRSKGLVVSTATVAIWAEKATKFGLQTASRTSFVPQIVFSKNDLKVVNDLFSIEFHNFEPIVMAI